MKKMKQEDEAKENRAGLAGLEGERWGRRGPEEVGHVVLTHSHED